MSESLGSIRGQLTLDAKQAITSYAAVRAANLSTVTAMSRGGAVMTKAGVAMMGTGLVIAAGFGVAVKAAAEYEKRLDFFGAVSNSTAAQMEKVSEKALQLGTDTRYSANEIAESFIELGKSGVTAEQIIGGVGEAVANLGAAADIPLVEASSIIVSAVQTFGLAAEDAVTVADRLTGAANASMVEVQDLGVSLKYAGGVAASLGIPFDDLNAAIAILGKYGIKGSTAGTSLRQMMIGLVGSTNKAKKVMEELGIITEDGSNKMFDASGKLKPLPEVMDILNASLAGLTQQEKIDKLKTMFNVRALPTVLNLLKEGSAGFTEMSTAIEKTKAADVAAARLDNLAGDIEILRGNIDTLLIKAGTPLQNFFRGIVQGITSLVQWFGNLSPGMQEFILKSIAIAAALLIFVGALTFLMGMAVKFVVTIVEFVRVMRLVITVIKLVSLAMKGFAVSLLANPVFLIIAAIVLLVVAIVVLYKKSETFRNFVKALGAAIVTAWNAVVSFFKGLPEFFSNLWQGIKDKTTAIWNAVINFFTVTIPTAFTNAWNAIITGISNFIIGVVTWFQQLPAKVLAVTMNLVNGVVNWFAQLPGLVGYWIGFLVGQAIRLWLDFQIFIITTAANIIMGVVNWFAELPGRVAAFFTSLWVKTQAIWNMIKVWLINTVTAIHNGVVDWFQKLPGRIAKFFEDAKVRVQTIWNNIKTYVITKSTEIYNGIINWFQKLPGRVQQLFNDLKDKAINKLAQLANSARDFGSRVYNGLVNQVQRIPGAVNGAIGNAIQAFKDMVSRAFSAAKDFASGLWNGFKKGLGINSPSFIEKQMVQITQVVDDETRALRGQIRQVQNLGNRLNQVSTMTPSTLDVARGAGQAMISSMKNERSRMEALQKQYSTIAANSSESLSRRILGDASMTTTNNLNQSAMPVRLTDEQLETLGKRQVNLELNNHNPVVEKDSVTTVKSVTRMAELGLFG